MRKTCTRAVKILAMGMLLSGRAAAQQAPAPNLQETPKANAGQAATAKPRQTPATSSKPLTAASSKPLTTAGTSKKATTAGTAQKVPVVKTGPAAAGTKSASAPALKTPKEKASYAIGLNIGKGLHRDGVDVDANAVARGLKDALAGGKTLLTDAEVQAALTGLQNDLRKKQEEKAQVLGGANKTDGEAFLAANKTKEGIVTLPSGLQYKILKEGTGPKPSASDSVVCNYRGTFLDAKEFDSSYKRGQPATFPVNGVIKGWTEALQLMPVGSKWELFIPPELGYGPRGAGPGSGIGPNATLIFEVELISIQGKKE